jgi:hypothetical protein
MFHFSEICWFVPYRLRAMLFGGRLLLAALISVTGTVDRVGVVADARLRQRQTENFSRVPARLALSEAEKAPAIAEVGARRECSSGRAPKCSRLEDREKAIRQLGVAACAVAEDSLGRRLAVILSETDI